MVVIDAPKPSPGATEKQAARVFRAGKLFAHLMADSLEELLAYADSIGIKRAWLQHPEDPTKTHFDVTGRRLELIKIDTRVVKLTDAQFRDWKRARDNRNKMLQQEAA